MIALYVFIFVAVPLLVGWRLRVIGRKYPNIR
jgi:ACR3 family arsenite efflux pump ArsB